MSMAPRAAIFVNIIATCVACAANRKAAVAPRPETTATPTAFAVAAPVAAPVAVPVAVPEPTLPAPVSTPLPVLESRPAEAAWKTTFESTIRPLLAQRCTPCHQPGGVMHGRLPFDDAQTVADAARDRPGFLRRLKGADHDLVVAWVATLPAR
jgi:hypothetical protein